ncbi:ChaB family protein [Francisella tularensis subsp. mediasiatica]|nr:ChaB family protein [Francisella tularensis]ACD30796.1 conserved domain protein [Francisella tularensis subsp. mediasiatica FSC147]MBK2078767.1 ChaB family protein [Francisella tularensis subsp. mediasiatica]MBK2101243.1 ChaB family protein [Francisella tularensis subsp. mediasiatica]MBK2104870.1 ChaB family protein [Francisella tularensis subsp. mediasiatica]MDN9003201.1 ChaB family protein [Francisella tularensis subsp. mediasiatica]
MPYNKLAELPKRVKNVLPYHAQEIYQAAFNNAWKEYRDKSKRRTNDNLETIAHEVAWSAVKKNIIKMSKQENGVKSNIKMIMKF